MVYFYSALILIWTGLFAIIFLGNPGAQLKESKPMPNCVQLAQPSSQPPVPLPPPLPSPSLSLPPPKAEPPAPKAEPLEYLPITKGSQIPAIATGRAEIPLPTPSPAPPPSIEDQIRTLIENRLVAILVRVNIAACTRCTPDDKRVILQLKMAKALTEGKIGLAQYYSKEMNKYIKPKPKK